MVFIDGELVASSFPTREGLVDAIAHVGIVGGRLELLDPAVYSGDGTRIYPGVRQMLEIARQVEAIAKLQVFTWVMVRGTRLSGATPGRSVLLNRRIR